MSDVRGAIVHMVNLLAADGELDDADLARIAERIASERQRITDEKHWRDRMHVLDAPHRPVIVTLDDGAEDVDVSAMRCGDCSRELVADSGSERVLVCPRIHGKRPPGIRPSDPDGAVYCGG
jgi:hypothetical protein